MATSNTNVPDTAGEVRGLVVRRNVYNNTLVGAVNFGIEWCCANPGAQVPMTIHNNIFSQIKEGAYGFWLPTGGGNTAFTNNCLYRTGARAGNVSESGTVSADPLFVDRASGNYALRSASPCAGKGSAITSLNQLLNLTGGTGGGGPVSTNTPLPPPTLAPSATPTRLATATPLPPTATSAPATATPPPTATSAPATATPPPPTNAPTAQPTSLTLTFEPEADAYVDAAHRNRNAGGAAVLRTYGSPEQLSFLRFNVQGLAGR